MDPREEDASSWGTGARMQRFLREAIPLGKEAVSAALAAAGVPANEVGLIVVASSTGYAMPGLDIILARDLGMPSSVQRLALGHMGCHAAMPALGAASDFVTVHGGTAVVLCCELPSLHAQAPSAAMRSGRPETADIGQVIAHSLYSDAAAAMVIAPSEGVTGLRPATGPTARPDVEPIGGASVSLDLIDIVVRTDTTAADDVTCDITDLGFRLGLSPRIPDVVGRQLRPVADELLARHGLFIGDVAAWAMHPGGPRILDAAVESLGLDDASLATSLDILREPGNCSSASILLVLERIIAADQLTDGDHVVMVCAGPGLTVCAALLRARRPHADR